MPRTITQFWWESGKSKISFDPMSELQTVFAKGFANMMRANPDTHSSEKVFDQFLNDFRTRAEFREEIAGRTEGEVVIHPRLAYKFMWGGIDRKVTMEKRPLRWKGLGTEMAIVSVGTFDASETPAVQPTEVPVVAETPVVAQDENQQPVAVAAEGEVNEEAARNFDAGDIFSGT